MIPIEKIEKLRSSLESDLNGCLCATPKIVNPCPSCYTLARVLGYIDCMVNEYQSIVNVEYLTTNGPNGPCLVFDNIIGCPKFSGETKEEALNKYLKHEGLCLTDVQLKEPIHD